jgi:hypothetical protein
MNMKQVRKLGLVESRKSIYSVTPASSRAWGCGSPQSESSHYHFVWSTLDRDPQYEAVGFVSTFSNGCGPLERVLVRKVREGDNLLREWA